MKKCKGMIVFSAILICFLSFFFINQTVSAADGGISWNYEDGILTVTGEGRMTDVAEGGLAPWSEYAHTAKEIHIESGITSIGARSFYGFSSVTKIVLADTVGEIGAHAFFGCSSLKNLELSDYLNAIGEGAFRSCSSLENVMLPATCRSLGAYAFASCNSLETIFLPASLSDVGQYAFFGATSLREVQIPATLKKIPEACFRNCSSLNAISFSTLLTSIGDYAFYGCSALKTCRLPDGLTEIGDYAFSSSGIQSAELPDSVEKIGAYAFSSCRSLVNLTLPSKTKIVPDGMCFSCEKLTEIKLPESLQSIGREAFSYCLTLKTVTLPANLHFIGEHAFAYDSALTTASFLAINCFVSGDVASPVFRGCAALSEMIFGEQVTLVPSALCYGLTSLNKVSFGGAVREIGKSSFEGCTNLSSVRFPDSLQKIGESAFYRCFSLKSVLLPEKLSVVGKYGLYTSDGGRIFAKFTDAGSGFSDTWNGEAEVFFDGNWAICEFIANGKEIDAYCLPLGETCSEPIVENYESRKGYTAYFSGWDINGDGRADALPLQVWQSFRAVALFREIPNRYLCRFFDDDGSLIAEYSLYYDSPITLPEAPSKPSTAQYSFTFSGWSGYIEGMLVSGNHDFTANYQAILLDLKAPQIVGVSDKEIYYAEREICVTDDGTLARVEVDGVAQPIAAGRVTFVLRADGSSHTIMAEDQAGWKITIEVKGVNIASLLESMPTKDMAKEGEEEKLLCATTEIEDLLSITEITDEDRAQLTARRKELLDGYRTSVLPKIFHIRQDDSGFLVRESIITSLTPLFDDEEIILYWQGQTVRYDISITAISSEEKNDNFHSLAKMQDKKTSGGFELTVARALTNQNGSIETTVLSLPKGTTAQFQISEDSYKSGTVFLCLNNETAEILTPNEAHCITADISGDFSFALLKEIKTSSSPGWRLLLLVVVSVSLVTTAALAVMVKSWARRRGRLSSITVEIVPTDEAIEISENKSDVLYEQIEDETISIDEFQADSEADDTFSDEKEEETFEEEDE